MNREPSGDIADPLVSIIIPTYQRKQSVLRCIESLTRLDTPPGFEAIVVVDGSTDGTAEAVSSTSTRFTLTVVRQSNQGAAAARNAGAKLARGKILLFLDDDMEAHPALLVEHLRSHEEGADAVLGHLPLHPDSPRSMLSAAVGDWAEGRLKQLTTLGAPLTLHDMLTGQLSVSAAVFRRLGGFDGDFTRGGSFGNEDVDFGYRLLRSGCRIVFNPDAISWQNYMVGPEAYFRQWRDAGKADVAFTVKHPQEGPALFRLNGLELRSSRLLWRPLSRIPLLGRAIGSATCQLATWLIRRGGTTGLTARLFANARRAQYWLGVQEAGGLPRFGTVRVLAYHAIRDLAGTPVLAEYGTPARALRAQLVQLKRAGFEFLSGEEFLSFLQEPSNLPARAVLVTFDDCYDDLGSEANSILTEIGIPAVAFAVSSRIGGANEWDARLQAPALPLLDAGQLRSLEGRLEIGAHSRTHPDLSELDATRLDDEIAGSISELEGIGLRRPRYFCYPYGQHGPAAREAVRRAGFAAAFTVEPGVVMPGTDRLRLPRIEILRSDGHRLRFWLKIASAGAPFESFSDRVAFMRDLVFATLREALASDRSGDRQAS